MKMMLKKRAKSLAALAAAVLLTAGVHAGGAPKADDHMKAEKDIVETAVAAGSFKTLAAALQAAGLVDALKGAGPFTVFAPTDEAFAKLPAGAVEELLKPENKEKLKAVLLYHVVPGKVTAGEVVKLNGKEAKTLQGSKVKVRAKGGVMIDNANVVKTDVMASNGVIHVIDTVLMPGASAAGGKVKKSHGAASMR
jgi:uncharacterized surface protein with fasciclin (FAS1) repeats